MLGNKTKFLAIILFFIVSLYFINGILADPIGEVDTAGNTWEELQWHISGPGTMIVLDTTDNTTYITWTYAPPPPLEDQRRSYYNSYNPLSGWAYPEPGCWMFPGVSNQINHTLMLSGSSGGLRDIEFGFESEDWLFGPMRAWWEADSFRAMPLDTIGSPIPVQINRAYNIGGRVCLVGIRAPSLLFGSYQIQPYSFQGWQFVDSIHVPYFCVATSPISERVAICYLKPPNLHNPHWAYEQNFDVYLISSPDGVEWDWENKINLTNFCNINPLRPLGDCDLLIDHNDQIHLAFTTWEMLPDTISPDSTRVNPFMTHLWHWSEASDSFSLIADGWIHQPPPCDSCDFMDRWPVFGVQLAEDPNTHCLYAVYQRYSFADCSYGPPHPNGEIWVSVSTDGGLNWSAGTDITNTHTPHCHPWQCACEMQPSINDLVNDTLHIAYILDRDADITDYDEMWMTEAKVIYHQVPVELIPTIPLLSQFSIYEGPSRCTYTPGDINGDGRKNGNDVVYAVNFFKGSQNVPAIDCNCEGLSRPYYAAGDVNGSCTFNGLDITFYVAYLKGNKPKILFCAACPPDEARPVPWNLRIR